MISRACSTVTPFLCPQLRVLLGELVAQLAGPRVVNRGAVQVDAEFGCAGADLALVTENRQLGDTALQQSAGGLKDSVVVTFGQHDALAIRAGPLAQLVGEHLRRGHLGDRNRQLGQQIRHIDMAVHQLQRRVDLALRRRGHPAAGRRRRRSPCRMCRARWRSSAAAAASPATNAAIDWCNSNPPLRMMHDSDGNPSAACALATANTTSERSPA